MTTKLTSIVDVFAKRPHVFAPLMEFAERVMRGPGVLTQGERELIAAMTSNQNGCGFCYFSHAAVSDYLNGQNYTKVLLDAVDREEDLTPRIWAFWEIVTAMREVGEVPSVAALTEMEVHEVVTIVASFNLFNRLVHAYGIEAASPEQNAKMGEYLATVGYIAPTTDMEDEEGMAQLDTLVRQGETTTIYNMLNNEQVRQLAVDWND